MDIRHWKWWAATAFLTVGSVGLRRLAFSQTPYANGWDSYFYLIQVKSWVESGRMHSPEASLIYPLMRFFCWIAGDYVSGYKWCTAVLAGAWVGLMQGEGLGIRFAVPNRFLPAALALFSPHLTYFAAQYPKNLLGLSLLLLFIRSLPETRKMSIQAWVTPFILLIINYFGHRLCFALALVFLGIWLLFAFGKNLRRVFFSLKAVGIIVASALLFGLVGHFAPGLFHLADFERLSGVLSPNLQFSPWSFVQDFGWNRLSGWWIFEIVCVLALLAWATWRAVVTRNSSVVTRNSSVVTRNSSIVTHSSLVFCALLLFPFLEWSLTGLAYRFFLVFVLLAPVLLAETVVFSKKLNWVLTTALVAAAFFSWKSYDPKKHDPDYRLFDKVTKTVEADSVFRSSHPELVIVPNALAEFFTYRTGTYAMPWLPEYPVAPERLWRIAANMRVPELEYFTQAPLALEGSGAAFTSPIRRLPGGYLLLREDRWQRALLQARIERDSDFVERATNWPNPARVRPGYLLQRKGG